MTTRKLTPASRHRRAGHLDHEGHFDRGAAAVEMALVMPLLILMVMGIIDFGRIFNGEIQLSQAAREGARIAALGTPGGFTADNAFTRAKAALTNPAFQGDLPFTGSPTTCDPTQGCISVDVVAAGGGSVTPSGVGVCATTDANEHYGQVIITIPYKKILLDMHCCHRRRS